MLVQGAFIPALSVPLPCAAVIVVRMLYALALPRIPAREKVVIGWTGMRGAVSLAAALSIPFSAGGRPLILFLTIATIMVTLVGQGLTLPLVVRRFAPADPRESEEIEERARRETTQAALERIDEIAGEADVPREALDHARQRYELRRRHLSEEAERHELPAARNIQRATLEAEREALDRLHAEGEIDQDTARRLERELDLEEERWGELEGSTLS